MLENREPYHHMGVTVANKAVIHSVEKGNLRVPAPSGDMMLPSYVFPDNVLSQNLAGLSHFCNRGCTVTLTGTDITIYKDGTSVWHGTKAINDTLWHLDLADLYLRLSPQTGTAFQTIRLDTDHEFVAFAHAVMASCPISTLLKAMDAGWLSNYPKLTSKMIRNNPPVSRATALGYLDQTRQGQHSTQPAAPSVTKRVTAPPMISEDEEDEDDDPFLRLQVLPASACTTNSSDATGKFPFPTKSGWNYLLVSTMNGYIHLELMANRSKKEYLRVYESTYEFYKSRGHTPTAQRLDNETSSDLENFFKRVWRKFRFLKKPAYGMSASK
jgi:hypothetical protein